MKNASKKWFFAPLFSAILVVKFKTLEQARHKYNMTNKQFLQSIYDTVKALGIVKSQYEFGDLCGREQSWFSCAKSVNRKMTVGAMVSLAVSLQNIPAERVSKRARPHVKKLIAEIWKMVEAQGTRRAA
jgi:hypothetical protein